MLFALQKRSGNILVWESSVFSHLLTSFLHELGQWNHYSSNKSIKYLVLQLLKLRQKGFAQKTQLKKKTDLTLWVHQSSTPNPYQNWLSKFGPQNLCEQIENTCTWHLSWPNWLSSFLLVWYLKIFFADLYNWSSHVWPSTLWTSRSRPVLDLTSSTRPTTATASSASGPILWAVCACWKYHHFLGNRYPQKTNMSPEKGPFLKGNGPSSCEPINFLGTCVTGGNRYPFSYDVMVQWSKIALTSSGDTHFPRNHDGRKGTRPREWENISHHVWEVRKIIDSKVPFTVGDMWSFPRGCLYIRILYIYSS